MASSEELTVAEGQAIVPFAQANHELEAETTVVDPSTVVGLGGVTLSSFSLLMGIQPTLDGSGILECVNNGTYVHAGGLLAAACGDGDFTGEDLRRGLSGELDGCHVNTADGGDGIIDSSSHSMDEGGGCDRGQREGALCVASDSRALRLAGMNDLSASGFGLTSMPLAQFPRKRGRPKKGLLEEGLAAVAFGASVEATEAAKDNSADEEAQEGQLVAIQSPQQLAKRPKPLNTGPLFTRPGGGKKYRRCMYGDGNCTKQARGADGLCIAHGGGKRCRFPGCTKSAVETRTGMCKGHGGGRRCSVEGCQSSAASKAMLCKAHGGGRRCTAENCGNSASSRSQYCGSHGGGKRCELEGCNSVAAPRSKLCLNHGGGRRCSYPGGCDRAARAGSMLCPPHGREAFKDYPAMGRGRPVGPLVGSMDVQGSSDLLQETSLNAEKRRRGRPKKEVTTLDQLLPQSMGYTLGDMHSGHGDMHSGHGDMHSGHGDMHSGQGDMHSGHGSEDDMANGGMDDEMGHDGMVHTAPHMDGVLHGQHDGGLHGHGQHDGGLHGHGQHDGGLHGHGQHDGGLHGQHGVGLHGQHDGGLHGQHDGGLHGQHDGGLHGQHAHDQELDSPHMVGVPDGLHGMGDVSSGEEIKVKELEYRTEVWMNTPGYPGM